jgi:hypothetical protein
MKIRHIPSTAARKAKGEGLGAEPFPPFKSPVKGKSQKLKDRKLLAVNR